MGFGIDVPVVISLDLFSGIKVAMAPLIQVLNIFGIPEGVMREEKVLGSVLLRRDLLAKSKI